MSNPIEESVTRAPELGAANAAADGFEGVFVQLVAEHREAASLLDRLSDSDPVDEREALWRKLNIALVSHERAELREIYAAFKRYPALQVIIREHSLQADDLEDLIEDLEALPVDAPEWSALFRRLDSAVRAHVQREEHEFFPQALQVIGTEEAAALREPYRLARLEIKKNL